MRETVEKLGVFIDASRDDVLACMDFPREHWAQIASANPLECVNREVKRRAGVIGIFPNDEWTVARRCMSHETIAGVTENPAVRLSAVAT